jgi:hypothetical protein
MAMSVFEKINNLFNLFCVIATVSLTIYCICNYLRNEDVSVVNFTTFYGSKEDVYPSFSFCIGPPLLEQKFVAYGREVNITTYTKFLKGKLWDERMLVVEYDNVTVSLKENVLDAYVILQNRTQYPWKPKYRVSFRSVDRKCFTIDAPDVDQSLNWYFEILIKNSIFPHGKRPHGNDEGLFVSSLHYPGQRFTGYYTFKSDWKLRTNNGNNYHMNFKIQNVDVTRHRWKSNKCCFEDWKNYDQYVMDNIMLEAKCHPPLWNPTSNLSLCSNSTQFNTFIAQPSTAELKKYDPPVIQRLDYHYWEEDNEDETGK